MLYRKTFVKLWCTYFQDKEHLQTSCYRYQQLQLFKDSQRKRQAAKKSLPQTLKVRSERMRNI